MREIHVHPTGDVSADGRDVTHPLKTIHAAQRAVRTTIKRGERDITVHVGKGEYFLTSPLVLSDEDSPVDGSVRWRGPDDASAIVNAGYRLTGWTEVEDGLYRTTVPEGVTFGTLFENGVPCPLARYPSDSYLRTSRLIENDKRTSFGFDASDLPEIAPGQSLSIFMFPGGPDGHWNWSSVTLPVEVDRDNTVARLESEMPYEIGAGSRYYWRGAREFLTGFGQFWLDRDEGVVFYRPVNTPIESQIIVAPISDRIIDFRGASPGRPVQNIQIERLTLRNCDYPESACGSRKTSGALILTNATQISIKYCRIHNTGFHGIHLSGWAQDCEVYGCDIYNVGHTGVQLDGDRGRSIMTCRGNRIVNNHVHDTGKNVGHGAGIQLSFAGENTISHNRVHHAPRYAISIKGPCPESMVHTTVDGVRITPSNLYDYHFTKDNLISHNDMYRVNLDTQDTGVYESWGTGIGNRLISNHIHDSDIEFSFGFGIYLDDASSGYTVEGNLVHSLQRGGKGELMSAVYTKGLSNDFRNNFLVDNPASVAVRTQAYATEPCRWLRFSRNVMYRSGAAGIGFVNWDWERLSESDYNLYGPDTEYYHWAKPNPGKNLERWDAHMKTIYDLHSESSDPGFMDPDRHDYRLRYDSPARKLGIVDIDLIPIGLLADFPFTSEDAAIEQLYLEAHGSITFVRVAPGERVKLRHHVRNTDGVPVNPDLESVGFASSNEKIATIDGHGYITAVGEGVTEVTASIQSGNRNVDTPFQVVVSNADA